jgi:hypothetical protein
MAEKLRLTPYAWTIVEQFAWASFDGKTTICFPVTRMLADIASGTLPYDKIETALDIKWAREWLSQRELNYDYCRQLSPARLDEPVLGVWMPRGAVLTIDGGHRYAERLRRRFSHIRFHVIAAEHWIPYATITGPFPPKD